MKALTTYTEQQVSDLPFKELAPVYNTFAKALDQKELKKFADKTKGAARVLKIQTEYLATVKPVKAKPAPKAEPKPVKATKAKAEPKADAKPADSFSMDIGGNRVIFDVSKATLESAKDPLKEGTIHDTFAKAIEDSLDGNLSEVIPNFMKLMKDAPVSGQHIDRAFVIRRMKRLVNKGYLKLQAV